MKTGLIGLVVFALLAPVSQAAAPRSLIGTWKVGKVKVDGQATIGEGVYVKGALWKLKKNGAATIADIYGLKWAYDASDTELVLTQWLSGMTKKFAYSVTSQGNDVKLKFQFQGKNIEVVLTPD